MKKEVNTNIRNIILTVTAVACTTLVIIVTVLQSTQKAKVNKDYSSLYKLQRAVNFQLDIPSKLIKEYGYTGCTSILGQVAQINANNYVLKASTLVDNNADILGMYEKANVDNKYNVSDKSDIKYFRYRSGYTGYTHSKLINWCTKETEYGLIIEDDSITEDKALELLGLTRESLHAVEEALEKSTVYTICTNWEISIPYISDLKTVEFPNYTLFYKNGRLIFIIKTNESNIKIDNSNKYKLTNELDLIYRNNSFKTTDDAYAEYNKFVSNIGKLSANIVEK